MAAPPPRCVNCQNFSGCQGTAGVCRVWQIVVPALMAAANRCPFWTQPARN